ncbi:MAG: tRNA pseudouridine(55) synthase TruB [Thermodesulfovibrionales bacterium]|nr:tRNA pseudouridine(55) synthase TruB [Thermodesulfovibrionales bacterium]
MNAVLNLNKERGITSSQAVIKVKGLLKVKKAGHVGTLDPLATGVLLVCLNEATKISNYLTNLDKEYLATMKLGEVTDTYDSEGRVIGTVSDFEISFSDIMDTLNMFIGEIDQIPPIYSAIKFQGKPLYKLARQGMKIDIKPRKISIESIDLIKYEPPYLTIRVVCSKGTFIRSLCNDIGQKLGVGAHLTDLMRTRIGHFTLSNSSKFEELPAKGESFYSIDQALMHMPEIILRDSVAIQRFKNGNPIKVDLSSSLEDFKQFSQFFKIKDLEGKILGIGGVSRGLLKPERLLHL